LQQGEEGKIFEEEREGKGRKGLRKGKEWIEGKRRTLLLAPHKI